MKQYFLHLAAALLSGACLFAASCSDSGEVESGQPTVDPVFPQAVELTIGAGESRTLSISPNMDWEVSIPTTGDVARWFWIQDGSQQVYKVRGSAGSAEVEIHTSDLEEFDESPVCEVSMTMGGETRIIATLTRGTIERTFSLRTSQLDEAGDFVWNDDEDSQLTYRYDADDAARIDLTWPEGRSGYMRPVLIEANFNWRLAEKPDWMSNLSVSNGTAGSQVEIRLDGDVTQYPLDGDDNGRIVFCDADNTEASYAFTVTIPACRDMLRIGRISKDTPLKFNAKGQYYNASSASWTDTGAYGDIVSAEGAQFFVVVKEGDYCFGSPEKTGWVHIEAEAWDSQSGEVVQSHSFIVSADRNSGDARSAELLALPASLAAAISDPDTQLFSDDYMSIREEYQPYVFATIEQALSNGAVSALNPEGMAEVGAEFRRLAEGEWPWEYKWAAIPDAYKLTYTREWSYEESYLAFEEEFTSYEVYGYEACYEDPYDPASCWISVERSESGVLILMDPDRNTKPGYSGENEATVVFSNDEGDFAIIYCVYDPDAVIGGSGSSVEFAYPDLVRDATLEDVTDDPAFADYNPGNGAPVYHLTYGPNASNAVLNVPSYTMSMSMNASDWLYAESYGSTQCYVYMDSPTTATGSLYFYNSSWSTVLVLVCTINR